MWDASLFSLSVDGLGLRLFRLYGVIIPTVEYFYAIFIGSADSVPRVLCLLRSSLPTVLVID